MVIQLPFDPIGYLKMILLAFFIQAKPNQWWPSMTTIEIRAWEYELEDERSGGNKGDRLKRIQVCGTNEVDIRADNY